MKTPQTKRLFVRLAAPLVAALILTSCAGRQESLPTDNCSAIKSGFNYYDSTTFDSRLSRTMACQMSTVKLRLPSPESTGKIPARLDRWLAAVDESGGQVTVEKDPGRKSKYTSKSMDGGFIVGAIVDLVEVAKIAYQGMKDKKLYGPAEEYNAIIYYEDGTGAITEVIFSKR